MLSPEIENMSVCEITSRDTYINNKPVLGGLLRMGVQDPGLVVLQMAMIILILLVTLDMSL